jgi:hypothetical protein
VSAQALKADSSDSSAASVPGTPTHTRAGELSALRAVVTRTIEGVLSQEYTLEHARTVVDGATVLLDLYESEQTLQRKEQHERKR